MKRGVLILMLAVVLGTTVALPSAGASLADSPWPMRGHDAQQTGRSPYNGPSTPAKKWEFATDDDVLSSPSIGSDGTIYLGSEDGKLYAINPANGSKKWGFATDGYVYSPTIGSDGTIYVGSADSKLYAVNPANGSKKWEFTAGFIVFSPSIGSDGTLYACSYDERLYAINPADGSKKWEFATGGDVGSSPAIDGDGTIYVGSYDDKLYAIGQAVPRTAPTVSNPVAPSMMSRTKSYTVYAELKPRHDAGTHPIRIYKYRFVSGKWKSSGYVSAKAADYSTYTRCSVKLRLATTGSWRLRAYAPADSAHLAKWSSGYDYVKVK